VGTQAERSIVGSDHPCVARQPILDLQGKVFAYELLFRRSPAMDSCDVSSNDASARVIVDAILSIGLDMLTGGKLAFFNLSRDMLLRGAPTLLPHDRVVIELLENIQDDAEVLETCTALKRSGYKLALDDVVSTESIANLVPLADYIKVDFRAADSRAARALVLDALPARRPHLLAEKVETTEQFAEAVAEGFTHFQGYHFGRPASHAVKRIAERRGAYAMLLVQLNRPDIGVTELEEVIKQDASLSYRVLRALNSASTPLRVEIRSIRQAIILLGRDTIRRWASLWAITALGASTHPELVASSIIRARCCEMVDLSTNRDSGSGFLLGMCSLLDLMLEQPMEVALSHLPLERSLRAALQGDDNDRRALLDCVIAYERGDWDLYDTLAARAGTSTDVLRAAHHDALRWTRELSRALP
jgi:c-di-GMP-related signal transduction protein